jgi:hypothetical protein
VSLQDPVMRKEQVSAVCCMRMSRLIITATIAIVLMIIPAPFGLKIFAVDPHLVAGTE